MRSKKFVGIVLGLLLVLAVSASAIYADAPFSKKEIATGFDKIKENLEQAQNLSASVVAEGDGIQIPTQDVVFYKNALKLVNSLQNNKAAEAQAQLSDDQIIDILISKELAAQQAYNLGLNVSSEEVDQVIANERKALDMKDDPANDYVRELMANRIRITGLSEDEFYKSESVRTKYAKEIVIGKLYTKLLEDGTVTNPQEFQQYEQDLLNSRKGDFSINSAALNSK
jgi:hypothetical protein